MTLQHYVNCIRGTLIHHKRRNSDVIIEEILHSIVSTYHSYIMGISEILNSVSKIQKEIKMCDEEIRKLDDGQVEERKNKETEKINLYYKTNKK